jgi:hypothetical protein
MNSPSGCWRGHALRKQGSAHLPTEAPAMGTRWPCGLLTDDVHMSGIAPMTEAEPDTHTRVRMDGLKDTETAGFAERSTVAACP